MSPRDTPNGPGKADLAKGVPGRGENDNVTYVNFGKRRKVNSAEETRPDYRQPSQHDGFTPRPAESERWQSPVWSERVKPDTPRNSILNSGAERVMGLITNMTDSGRLARGRQYARGGHVVEMDIRVGAVHGQVAGSQNQPFAVLIQLPYRDNADIEKLTGLLARNPNSIRDAMGGELTSEALDILLAPTGEDIRFECTCPDHGHVCKHIVAVADRLALRIDADPLQLFELRGIDILSLRTMVMAAAEKAAEEARASTGEDTTGNVTSGDAIPGDETTGENEDASAGDAEAVMPEKKDADHPGKSAPTAQAKAITSELFWNGRELPDMPRPKVAPALDDSDPDLLRKAMRAVSHTNVDLLRAVSDVEDLYHFMTSRN